MLKLQLAGIKLRQVENIVEQLHQYLARVMRNGQLLTLFGVEGAVQRQR